MNAAAYTAARYLVSWAFMYLAQRGWTVANVDGATLDAVTQLVVGIGGAVAMLVIGVSRSTLSAVLARLKAHHKTDLLDAAASVPGVAKIEATQELALSTVSPKVVAP